MVRISNRELKLDAEAALDVASYAEHLKQRIETAAMRRSRGTPPSPMHLKQRIET